MTGLVSMVDGISKFVFETYFIYFSVSWTSDQNPFVYEFNYENLEGKFYHLLKLILPCESLGFQLEFMKEVLR